MKYFRPQGTSSYYWDLLVDFDEDGWAQSLFRLFGGAEKKHKMWYEMPFHLLCTLA